MTISQAVCLWWRFWEQSFNQRQDHHWEKKKKCVPWCSWSCFRKNSWLLLLGNASGRMYSFKIYAVFLIIRGIWVNCWDSRISYHSTHSTQYVCTLIFPSLRRQQVKARVSGPLVPMQEAQLESQSAPFGCAQPHLMWAWARNLSMQELFTSVSAFQIKWKWVSKNCDYTTDSETSIYHYWLWNTFYLDEQDIPQGTTQLIYPGWFGWTLRE